MTTDILRSMTWEDIRDITTAVYEVPIGKATTAEQYFKNILRHLRDRKNALPPIEERYPGILACAELACGRELTESRDKGSTVIRCFVAYKLHREGYYYSEIGKMMHRDHSSITNLAYRMRDMLSLPNAYKREVEMYREFERLCK